MGTLKQHDPNFRILIVVCFGILLAALLGPLIWPYGPDQILLADRLKPPSALHPFGTDQFGRDVLARFLSGARLSILFGLVCVVSAAILGTLFGLVAGLHGGWVDSVISRLLDAVLAFPALILAMAVAIAFKPGILSAASAVIIVAVPWYARRVRSEVLSLRSRPYVEAAYVLGASRLRIIFLHILPSLLSGVVAQASLGVGYAVLTLSALGFLGLGVQPPVAEWGSMITDGRRYLFGGNWWLSIFPGLGIVVLVALAFVLGNHLSDRLGRGVGSP